MRQLCLPSEARVEGKNLLHLQQPLGHSPQHLAPPTDMESQVCEELSPAVRLVHVHALVGDEELDEVPLEVAYPLPEPADNLLLHPHDLAEPLQLVSLELPSSSQDLHVQVPRPQSLLPSSDKLPAPVAQNEEQVSAVRNFLHHLRLPCTTKCFNPLPLRLLLISRSMRSAGSHYRLLCESRRRHVRPTLGVEEDVAEVALHRSPPELCRVLLLLLEELLVQVLLPLHVESLKNSALLIVLRSDSLHHRVVLLDPCHLLHVLLHRLLPARFVHPLHIQDRCLMLCLSSHKQRLVRPDYARHLRAVSSLHANDLLKVLLRHSPGLLLLQTLDLLVLRCAICQPPPPDVLGRLSRRLVLHCKLLHRLPVLFDDALELYFLHPPRILLVPFQHALVLADALLVRPVNLLYHPRVLRHFLCLLPFFQRHHTLEGLSVVRLLLVVPLDSLLEPSALLVQHKPASRHRAHLSQEPFAIVVGSEGNRVDGRRGMRQARNEALDLPRLVHVAVGQQPDLRAVGAGSCRPQRPQQATRHAPRASRADHLVLPHSLLRARARDPPSHAPQLLFRPPGKFPPAALPAAALPPADRTIAAMRIVALVESQELEHSRPPLDGAKRAKQAGDQLLELPLPLSRHRPREVDDEDWRFS
mmetsp:Transcript_19544/g.44707  ORF Transcript_19544/g.44707 Transcript_19544/m.44707 type:complete len:643 (+) Transcript_19544:481-2409(+)